MKCPIRWYVIGSVFRTRKCALSNGLKKRILDLKESEVNDIENKYQEIFIAE
jgi:hypothetical protein